MAKVQDRESERIIMAQWANYLMIRLRIHTRIDRSSYPYLQARLEDLQDLSGQDWRPSPCLRKGVNTSDIVRYIFLHVAIVYSVSHSPATAAMPARASDIHEVFMLQLGTLSASERPDEVVCSGSLLLITSYVQEKYINRAS
jgi:hypothetical protein